MITRGEDRIVFACIKGRVFEMVNGDPFGSAEQAIDADPSIQNEIVFILETGSEFGYGHSGSPVCEGCWHGRRLRSDAHHSDDVSVPPLVSDILFSAGPVNVVGTDEDDSCRRR